jgi:hypothetical protein
LNPAIVKGFAALQSLVDIHQHILERSGFKSAQAVAKRVVTKGAFGANPVHQAGVLEVAFQTFETWEPKGESVKQGEKHAGGRDRWVLASVAHVCCMLTKSESLVEVGGKGGKAVCLVFHVQDCKKSTALRSQGQLVGFMRRPSTSCLSDEWSSFPPEQLAIDVRDLLQAVL